MNNTPFDSILEAAKHIRQRLRVEKINASVRLANQFGGFIRIQPNGGCDVKFSESEQENIVSMLSVNGFATAGHKPINSDVQRPYSIEGYIQTH